MAMSAHNDVLDSMLKYIADNGIELKVCTTAPADYSEANTLVSAGGKRCATTTLDAGIAGADYAIADGAGGPHRTLTVTSQAAVPITATGTAQHIAICTASVLLFVITLTSSQALTLDNTVTIPAFTITNADPT